MDYGSKPEIPSIVTEDIHVGDPVSPALPTTSTGHARKPSDPRLLSPGILKPGRWSIDTPGDDELTRIPPSPTLSTQSSVHFKTSTALRDNKPGDGTTSLSLLSPKDNSRSHSRRPSNATTISTDEGTVTDHSPGLSHPYPATSDVTRKENIDPTPFAFKPYHLASLVDPKNLETLEGMGGISGLLTGLGVDPASGLSVDGKMVEGRARYPNYRSNPAKEPEELDRAAVYQNRTQHLEEALEGAKRDLGVFEKAYHRADCDIRDREARRREWQGLHEKLFQLTYGVPTPLPSSITEERRGLRPGFPSNATQDPPIPQCRPYDDYSCVENFEGNHQDSTQTMAPPP